MGKMCKLKENSLKRNKNIIREKMSMKKEEQRVKRKRK